MIRIVRERERLTLISRLAKPRVVAVLAVALGAVAVGAARFVPGIAGIFAAAAVLLALLGGRAVRARFDRDRVRVRPAVPFQRGEDRRLGEFAAASVETVADARRRKAERLARQYQGRSGKEMPLWLHPSDTPGTNDHLRRIVLVPRSGEPLPVTAWLAEDDLEAARIEIEGLLQR